MNSIPEEQQGRFTCPVCHRRFRALREKKIHISSLHPRPKKVR